MGNVIQNCADWIRDGFSWIGEKIQVCNCFCTIFKRIHYNLGTSKVQDYTFRIYNYIEKRLIILFKLKSRHCTNGPKKVIRGL